MTLTAFVINLDRRPDRMSHFLHDFEDSGFDVVRVPAVDGRELRLSSDSSAFNPGIIGVNQSHGKAIKAFLDSGSDYCMIFEDDAMPTTKQPLITPSIAEELTCTMGKLGIGLLQLGHIPFFYRTFSRQGLGYRIAQFVIGVRIIRIKVGKQRFKLHLSQFRAGSHAYVISRPTALQIAGSHLTSVFVVDDFYSYLAQSNINHRKQHLFFACITPSMFEQKGRLNKSNLDSDSTF
jgi:hypothetical protein